MITWLLILGVSFFLGLIITIMIGFTRLFFKKDDNNDC